MVVPFPHPTKGVVERGGQTRGATSPTSARERDNRPLQSARLLDSMAFSPLRGVFPVIFSVASTHCSDMHRNAISDAARVDPSKPSSSSLCTIRQAQSFSQHADPQRLTHATVGGKWPTCRSCQPGRVSRIANPRCRV